MPTQPQKRKINPLAIVAVILLVLAAGMLFLIFAHGPRMKWALSMGEKYLTECDYTQAVTMISRAIRLDARSEPAYLGRAEAYIQLNQPAAAVEDLTFVIDELTTDDADVYIQRAEAYTMQGNTDAAQADLDTAASLGADTTAAEETLAALTPEPTPEPEKAFSLPVRYQDFLDADNPQTDIVATYYDNGKIRSTTSQGLTINPNRQFDENGHQVYSTSDFGDLTTTFQLDENGNIVRSDNISTSTFLGSSSETYTNTYTYDDHGNMTSYNTTASNPIDTEVRWVYEYDDEGRITHETSYKQDGDVYNDWTYVYAADGSYTMTQVSEYIYIDEADAYIEVDRIGKNADDLDWSNVRTMHYRADGTLASLVATFKASGVTAVNATFNENGDPLNVEVYNEAGQLYSTDVYTYNEKGLITQQRHTDTSVVIEEPSNYTYTYTYEYDADGNVTKRTGTYSDAGISGELREIITYEVRTLPADYEPYDLKAFLL